MCARRLNFRCREKGVPIPNPDAGFEDPPQKRDKSSPFHLVSKDGNGFMGRKIVKGKVAQAYGKTALECAKRLNYRCREAGFDLPNEGVGFADPDTRVKERFGYKHIRAVHGRFEGRKQVRGVKISVRGETLLQCAKKLNFKCKQLGAALPN